MKILIPAKGSYTRKMYRKIGYYTANNGDGYILPIYENGNIREVMYYTLQAIKHRIDTELLWIGIFVQIAGVNIGLLQNQS